MVCLGGVLSISIHAPREGGDFFFLLECLNYQYFNPRPPRGGRRHPAGTDSHLFPFQSTPPARGATHPEKAEEAPQDISIHAPREGGDI